MPRSPEKATAPERRRAERHGRRGELLAALFLRTKFYAVVARRYRTPLGEIDLVVRRGSTTVFVEVKTRRRSDSEAEALEAVSQGRIVAAANFYLMRHPSIAQTPLRFDVIFLAPWTWPRHIVDAFDAGGT